MWRSQRRKHEVHGSLHIGVAGMGSAAWRHHARTAGVAVDGVLIKNIDTLGEMRLPTPCVPKLGSAGVLGKLDGLLQRRQFRIDPWPIRRHGAVAGATHLFVQSRAARKDLFARVDMNRDRRCTRRLGGDLGRRFPCRRCLHQSEQGNGSHSKRRRKTNSHPEDIAQ